MTAAALASLWAHASDRPTLLSADGHRFAILGSKPAQPSPALFLFASECDTSLSNDDFARTGKILARDHGFLCVSVGTNDVRVGTDSCIAFTRAVVGATPADVRQASIELHVKPSPNHRLVTNAHEEAAAWLAGRLRLPPPAR